MVKVISLSRNLVMQAKEVGKAEGRSPSQQIEHWARLGKFAEDHSDLPTHLLLDMFNTKSLDPNQSLNRHKL